jgi:hypothetical protein
MKTSGFRGSSAPGTSSLTCSRLFIHSLRDSNRITREAVQNPVHSVAVSGPQERSPENEPAVSPAIANNTAVQIPPRGVEQPPDSGRETRNSPAPGTESGTPAADPLPELLALVVELPPEAAALLLKIARRLSKPPST